MPAKNSISGQIWLMVVAVGILFSILLVVISKNKKTVYLKPKDPNSNTPKETNPDFSKTQANENEEVQRSELQTLRQSAVSMSVGEKSGATEIVQDWLGDSPSEETNNDSDKEEDKTN